MSLIEIIDIFRLDFHVDFFIRTENINTFDKFRGFNRKPFTALICRTILIIFATKTTADI